MAPEWLAPLRGVIERKLGLTLDETREIELVDAFERRRAERGRRSPQFYLSLLETDEDELRTFGELLTVNETYFFRSREHLDVLREVVFPARPRSRGDELRILSAGCSSGEEPYSLAILLREWEDQGQPTSWRRWHVRGIDLSSKVLAKAEAGIYSSWSLRETPPRLRARWFSGKKERFELSSEIRRQVTFRQQNLLDRVDLPSGPFDVVFCRNVLMYFSDVAARAVVARLTEALVPGGYLFLGHTDTLRGLSTEYALESSHGTFYYRLGAVLPAPLPPLPQRQEPRPVRRDEPAPVVRPPPAPPQPATLEEVLELVSRERFDEALDRLATISKGTGEDTTTSVVRAVIELGRGDVEAARSRCQKLLASGEASVDAHLVLALVAESGGDDAAAVEHHRAALYYDPDCAVSHLHLGRIARRGRRIGEARHELGQALELLERELPSRLLLFAGGFTRAGLVAFCRSELASLGGGP